MKLNENIESAYLLVDKKKKLEEQKEEIEIEINKLKEKEKEIDEQISILDKDINPYKTLIMQIMKESDVKNIEVENIIAQIMTKTGFSWVDEESILNYLKNKKLTDYIQVKYSLKKPLLKKAIEQNKDLKEALLPYIEEKGTEYLVITDKESYNKMVSHMEEK